MHGIALNTDAFAVTECLAVFITVVLGLRVGVAIRECAYIVIAFEGTANIAANRGVIWTGEVFGRR